MNSTKPTLDDINNDWTPAPPDVDSSTAGRGAYDTHLDGIAGVNSIPRGSEDTYSDKSSYPNPKL